MQYFYRMAKQQQKNTEKQQQDIFYQDFRRSIEPVYQQCRETTNTNCESLRDKFVFALQVNKNNNNEQLQKQINNTMLSRFFRKKKLKMLAALCGRCIMNMNEKSLKTITKKLKTKT